MSVVVMKIARFLLFPFSPWGEILARGFSWCQAPFELVDGVRQVKCFLCFFMQPSSDFVLQGFCCFFSVVQSFHRAVFVGL